MTRTTRRSTAPDRLAPLVEDDPADSDVAAVDDALAAFTVAAAGHGAPRPLADYPAGSAGYRFRKRRDTEPGAKLTRISVATLWVGIAVLLVAEAADAIRTLRRRTAHLLAERWAAVERREHREARRAIVAEIAVLAARNHSASGLSPSPLSFRGPEPPRVPWRLPPPDAGRFNQTFVGCQGNRMDRACEMSSVGSSAQMGRDQRRVSLDEVR